MTGVVKDGRVVPEGESPWPDGTRVIIAPDPTPDERCRLAGHVIVVGFGLAGRGIVDLLDGAKIPLTIIEKNPVTVETQRALGRKIVHGDACDAEVLRAAGIHDASILALTIPDEEAVLDAVKLARRIQPDVFIIARTMYSSKGMKASQLGADDVIKAEQAVAVQFYDRMEKRLRLATMSA